MRIAPEQLHTKDDLFSFEEREGGSALDGHWTVFIAMLTIAVRSFGAPAKLFLVFLLEAAERNAALKLLRGLEAMLRRILLAEAGHDARPLEPLAPRKKPQPAKARVRGAPEPLLLKPEYLNVRFAIAPDFGAVKRYETQRPARQASEYWRCGFGIAARFEALLRAAKDPLPLVMRVRQQMAREQSRYATSFVMKLMHEPPRMERYLLTCIEHLRDDAMFAANRLYRGTG